MPRSHKVNELVFHTGPGTHLWPSVLRQAMKEPRQGGSNGWSCAIDVPGRAAARTAAKVDARWRHSRMYVDYDHESNAGTIACSVGGWRYSRPLTEREVYGVVVPFDQRDVDDMEQVAILFDLNSPDMTKTRARTGQPSRPREPRELTPAQAEREVKDAAKSAQSSGAAAILVQPSGNSPRRKKTNAAWSRRQKSLERLVQQMQVETA